jgi:DNA-binding GntR family transcriptional regulator
MTLDSDSGARPQQAAGHGKASLLAPDGQVALARELLSAAIVSGELAPGLVLSQPDLSERLGVGRTPLREAIRLLQQEGFLYSERNRRVKIATFSVEDLEDLYALRFSVEAAAIHMTVPFLSPEQGAELEGLVAQMQHYVDRNDLERFEMPHRQFHAMLVAGAGERSRRVTRSLADHAERYRRAFLEPSEASETSGLQHAQIMASALAHDPEACAQLVIDHYAETAEALATAIGATHPLARIGVAMRLAVPDADLGR